MNRPRLVVIAHLHHWVLWEEFQRDLGIVRAVVPDLDLLVTLPVDSLRELHAREQQRAAVRRGHRGAVVLLTENRGMDTAAFVHAVDYLNRRGRSYDLLFKWHSKTDRRWRRSLLDPLVRDVATATDRIHSFGENPRVGLVGAQKWLVGIRTDIPHAAHLPWLFDLAQYAEDPLRVGNKFIGGTIFLARFGPIAEWVRRVDVEDLVRRRMPMGRGPIPGIPHSIERLFGALMSRAGLEIVGVS